MSYVTYYTLYYIISKLYNITLYAICVMHVTGPVNIGKFGSPQRREVEMLWLALRDVIAAKRSSAPGFGQR